MIMDVFKLETKNCSRIRSMKQILARHGSDCKTTETLIVVDLLGIIMTKLGLAHYTYFKNKHLKTVVTSG